MNLSGSTGIGVMGCTTGIRGATGILGSTGVIGVSGMLGSTGLGNLKRVVWESRFLRNNFIFIDPTCCSCKSDGRGKEKPNTHKKYEILQENPIYKKKTTTIDKLLNKFFDKPIEEENLYICKACAIEAEFEFIENLVAEELPLWISFKWVSEGSEELFKKRLYEGK